MKVKAYEKGNVSVIEPSGKLMGGPDTGELDPILVILGGLLALLFLLRLRLKLKKKSLH